MKNIQSPISRNHFLSASVLALTGLFLVPRISLGQDKPQKKLPPVPDRGPKLESNLVYDFIRAAHFDLDRAKELHTKQPSLMQASWDWGGGDFEMAIDAASHMGRKDIANYLLDNGARMTLFAATMLGKLDLVKTIISTFPNQLHTKGPHGFSLIHHAKKGGEDAILVLEYFQSLEE